MATPYRTRSRHSDASSNAPRYPLTQTVSSSHYSSPPPSQYAYPASAQFGTQSPYGYYSTSSPPHLAAPPSDNGHSRSSLGSLSVPPTYSAAPTSERASKRQKASAAPAQGAYVHVQRSSGPAHGDPRYHPRTSGSRQGRESSVSSGYSSPGYSHSHDHFAQQLFQPPSIPGMAPSARDAQFYGMTHYQNPSSEYEEEEEERLDHGPTELPPRTYSGKSKYDPPRKPGKIPGSAMDYLPILEARFDRLETAIDRYVDYRGQRALSNSILPGMDAPKDSSSYYSRSSRQRDGA